MLAFAISLMAFEYRHIRVEKEEVPAMEKMTLIPEATPQPSKPEPTEKDPRSDKKDVDPELTPEVKDEPKERQEEPDPKEVNELPGIEGLEEKKLKEERIEAPNNKPNEPVDKHKLDRFAIFPACQKHSDPEKQEACTQKLLKEFIKKRTDYPEELRKMGVEEKLRVIFVIDRNGRVRRIRVAQSSYPRMDEAVEKAIQRLPQFVPAQRNGHDVPMRRVTPVSFNTL